MTQNLSCRKCATQIIEYTKRTLCFRNCSYSAMRLFLNLPLSIVQIKLHYGYFSSLALLTGNLWLKRGKSSMLLYITTHTKINKVNGQRKGLRYTLSFHTQRSLFSNILGYLFGISEEYASFQFKKCFEDIIQHVRHADTLKIFYELRHLSEHQINGILII